MANNFDNVGDLIPDGEINHEFFPVNSDEGNFQNGPPKASITKTIGSGDDAKNSVIWHIIFTTFCIFSCIVAALIIIDLYRTEGADAVQIVKDIWSIFTPILTLSLGYMFGSDSVKNKFTNQDNNTPNKQVKSEVNNEKNN